MRTVNIKIRASREAPAYTYALVQSCTVHCTYSHDKKINL